MDSSPLPDGWNWMTVEELAATNGRPIVSGPFGSNISSRFFVDRGIPVIRGSNLTTGMERFVEDAFVYVTEEKATELGNVDAIAGDLIFTAAGSLGQVGIIPSNSKYPKYIISNKQLRARLDTSIIEPLFAYYWLASKPMVTYIQQQNTGSSVPLINLSILKRLKVPVPSLDVQRAILEILGGLDAKIELNRRMNETLESLARALFKSWFVDFDPVRAKLDGRQPPNLPPATAALFPDSFEHVNGELMPRGWGYERAGEIADVAIGKTPPRKEPQWFSENPADIRWMSIKDLGACGAYIRNTSEFLTAEAVEKFRVRRIPDNTVVLSFKLTVGRVAITDGEMLSNEAIAHFNLSDDAAVGPEFLFCYLSNFAFDSLGSTSSIATAVNSKMVKAMSILAPGRQVAAVFGETVRPWFTRMKTLQRESETLAALRDTLLPRLLSGELRVADAERTILTEGSHV